MAEADLVANRRDQIFPMLTAAEIDRIRRLGECRAYPAGARILSTGNVAPGAFVVLSGRVRVVQRCADGEEEPIVTYGPGSFMGELAQLSGRPALVDAVAEGPVETLVIPPQRLHDLLFGDRIALAVLEKLQPRDQQPVAGKSRRALVLFVQILITKMVHGDAEAIGKCIVAPICQPRLSLRGG